MSSILQLQRQATCGRYDPLAYLALCRALATAGDLESCASILRRWQHLDPHDATIAYHRSVLLGKDMPSRSPDNYIVAEFDGFADSFDTVLADLDYRVPGRFAQILAQELEPGAVHRVADLGCGTGLCGVAARPHATRLCGIDLSPRMLQRARERGLYDALIESEISAYLEATDERFDLVLAGDSLIYFGDLQPVFDGIRRVTRPGALVLASFELGDEGGGATLSSTGRYQHDASAVADAIRSCGLLLDRTEICMLRQEGGMAVDGAIAVARCA